MRTLRDSPIYDRIIRVSYYLLFGLVPLLLTPWNYELFEFNKMIAVYALTAVITAAWLAKSIARRELPLARTPLDIPIALFVFSQLVSALFSMDPHVSWWGYYSRFNGGMWSVISYVLLYYGLLSNLPEQDEDFTNEARINITNSHKFEKSYGDKHSGSFAVPIREIFVVRLFTITLISAMLVALYGVLERLGIDRHLWVQDVQSRVFSTLGQPNWLAAYLVAVFPLALVFGIGKVTSASTRSHESNTNKESPMITNTIIRAYSGLPFVIYSCLSVLLFITLLFTKSRSGLIGFAVADMVFWGLVLARRGLGFSQGHALRNFIRPPLANNQGVAFMLLHIIMALIVFLIGTGTPAVDEWITLNGYVTKITRLRPSGSGEASVNNTATVSASPTYTPPLLEVGGTESGTIRKYVWQGAVNAWKSSPKTMAIGTGTETFAFAFYRFRPRGHNMTSEWDFLYNKAHNEYLNYLATAGIFGLGSYLLLIGTFIVWFIKNVQSSSFMVHDKESTSHAANYERYTINAALFSGWLSILVTNFFGFSVVIVQILFFLFPAMVFALSQPSDRLTIRPLRLPAWTTWIPVLAGLYMLTQAGIYWYADTLFSRGYRYNRAGLPANAVSPLYTASILRWGEPVYHDELAQSYANLAAGAFDTGAATQAAQLADAAVAESDTALAISPNNVNFWKTRTKVFFTLSALDPSLNTTAVEALNRALTLSPLDPKIYYNLAILVGRDTENDKAVEYLQKAKEIKPNYRDAYFGLSVFYEEMGKKQDATAILREYLENVDPNDQDFLSRIKQ